MKTEPIRSMSRKLAATLWSFIIWICTQHGRPYQLRVNARPRHEAPLSSDFMTSSSSVNRVRIVVEGRYAVQHEHENCARLLTFETKFASSAENVLCWQWRFQWILKRKLYLAKMNNLPRHQGAGPPEGRGPMQLHRQRPGLALNNTLS